MRRKITAIFAAVLVGGAIYGAAAALNLSSVSLGEGTATVSSCTASTTLTTTYNTSYDASQQEFAVDSVDVGNIPAACDAKAMNVVLVDASGNSIGTGSKTVVAPADGSSDNVTITGAPVTSAVVKAVVQITG